MKRVSREIIAPTEGSSFFVTHHKAPDLCHQNYWHFHPEFEIVYVPHGRGKRFIGYKASSYTEGDLVLLGPNILHNTFNFGFESPASTYEEYVIQFGQDRLSAMTDNFPEFARVVQLLDRARTGLCFTGKAKRRIGGLIREMNGQPAFQRLIQLFLVLREMSLTTDVQDLMARQSMSIDTTHSKRIQQVYQIIETQYQEVVSTRQIARELAMTESSFCRFFKHTTGKTLKQTLTEVRIQKASLLLSASDLPVATVASLAGFNNVSLFNRAFKAITKTTPHQYRRAIQAFSSRVF